MSLRALLLLFVLGVLFLFVSGAQSKQHDWDWMDCHNGTYYSGYQNHNGSDHCICNNGWTGVDCSLCDRNDVCSKGQICDTSLIPVTYKAYNCTPTKNNGVIETGSIAAQWDLSSNTSGTGVATFFLYGTGAPLVFNCTFSQCSQTVDDTSVSITCQRTSCHCTTWCNQIVAGIVDGMHSMAVFTCELSSSICTLNQKELPVQIETDCAAAGCQAGHYKPEKPRYTPLEKKLIIAGSVVGGALFIAGIVVALIIARRRVDKRNRQIWELVAKEPVPTTIEWRNLSCFIQSGGRTRKVLKSVTGLAVPGQITAIIGPSGAGKTTFLDILAGRKTEGRTEGDVLVNHQPRAKNFKRISGYVLQDDLLLGTLTVKEHLTYVAKLRLPSIMPDEEKAARVSEVLEELGITHIADSMIGSSMARGISGGERKRVAIASELVTDPSLLFLDEPTSGLDSANAFSLMESLKRLAKHKNRTVIVTIHQPRSNIYHLFDNLLVLSHGETIYYGAAVDAVDHFAASGYDCPQHYNPADFIIDTVTMNTKQAIHEIAEKYSNSRYCQEVVRAINSIQESELPQSPIRDDMEYASTFLTQISVLCERTMVNIFRNPYLLRTQYAVIFLLALLLGIIFWHVSNDLQGIQSRAGSLFFMITLLSFGSMSSLDTFFHERPLFVRERANGMYRTSTYFISKALCDIIPMRVIPPIILAGITYYMIGYHPGFKHFLYYTLAMILVGVVSTSMCLAISSSCPSLSMANLIAILILLFYLLFGGLLANKASIPSAIKWLKWLSFLNYAYEILMVNELAGTSIYFDPQDYNITPMNVNGEVFLKQFDMDEKRLHSDIFALCGMTAFYLLLSYAFLRFLVREKR